MRTLSDILYKCKLIQVVGATTVKCNSIVFDSRQTTPGCLFVAVKGFTTDGHQYIEQAINAGAVAVVCQEIPDLKDLNVTFVKVENSAAALGQMAANFYGNPSEKLKVIGITGTNGKTTIATLLHQLFENSGFKSGLLSTIRIKVGNQELNTTHTTPDAVTIQRIFSEMVEKSCEYCFMEVSSHAIDQSRITGIHFSGAVFTNITHDHLDYHKTFRNYLNAKKSFFDQLDKDCFALTNVDDRNGRVMLQNSTARKFTYGLKNMADYRGKVIENLITGLVMQIDNREVWCKLVGDFNAYNILAVFAVTRLLGMESQQALTAISQLAAVEGRFEYFISDEKITAIVDYAHTPDALENVLSTIKNLRTGNETLITVVGCGGNRDAEKRPLMAEIAASFSDKVVLTSDNPRFEEPAAIIKDMKKGLDPVSVRKSLVVENREEAIKVAVSLAQKGDIILVAGKGHEKYQEIKGKRHPFDDLEVLKQQFI